MKGVSFKLISFNLLHFNTSVEATNKLTPCPAGPSALPSVLCSKTNLDLAEQEREDSPSESEAWLEPS